MNVKETLAEIKRVGLLRTGNLQDQLNKMALSLESEAIELRSQVSALQTSQDNIINGLGIKGDGPVSKLVIEYVLGLVAERDALAAENVALKSAISNEVGLTGMMHVPETPATDAAIADKQAESLEAFAIAAEAELANGKQSADVIDHGFNRGAEAMISMIRKVANTLRAGRKG